VQTFHLEGSVGCRALVCVMAVDTCFISVSVKYGNHLAKNSSNNKITIYVCI
jgi:hypothetical protein